MTHDKVEIHYREGGALVLRGSQQDILLGCAVILARLSERSEDTIEEMGRGVIAVAEGLKRAV